MTETSGTANPPDHTGPRGLTRAVLGRNLSTVGLSYAAGSVAGFATQSVLGHRLGSAVYGDYVTGLALATTLSVVQEVAGTAWLVRITPVSVKAPR